MWPNELKGTVQAITPYPGDPERVELLAVLASGEEVRAELTQFEVEQSGLQLKEEVVLSFSPRAVSVARNSSVVQLPEPVAGEFERTESFTDGNGNSWAITVILAGDEERARVELAAVQLSLIARPLSPDALALAFKETTGEGWLDLPDDDESAELLGKPDLVVQFKLLKLTHSAPVELALGVRSQAILSGTCGLVSYELFTDTGDGTLTIDYWVWPMGKWIKLAAQRSSTGQLTNNGTTSSLRVTSGSSGDLRVRRQTCNTGYNLGVEARMGSM